MNPVTDNSDQRRGGSDSFLPLLVSLSLMLVLVPLLAPFPLLYPAL